MMNAQLDPQNPMHALAHVLPDEAVDHGPDGDPFHDGAAYAGDDYANGAPDDSYLDAPDAHLEAAYEDRTHVEDEPLPYDGGGWPGDGSGTDDLADLMAHGDEGCCDGPGDY